MELERKMKLLHALAANASETKTVLRSDQDPVTKASRNGP